MIRNKLNPNTDDEVCNQCDHCVDGECVGLVKAQEYYGGHFGNECEPERLKELLWRERDVLFHTPEGMYDEPYKYHLTEEVQDANKSNPNE